MKGIETIKDKIKKETAATIRKIRAAARKQTKEYDKKQEEFQKDYKEKFDERTGRLLDDLRQKKLAQARLKVKKDLLQAREEIINNTINEIIDNLDHKDEKYKKLLNGILEENIQDFSGKITVKCSKEDAGTVKELMGNKAEVEEDSSLHGGIVIEDDTGKRVDESLSMILERKRDRIRQEIAGVLA